MKFPKHLLPLFVILVFSIIVSLPLLKPGLYQIHDDQQIARLYLYDQTLKSGQFPVRWLSGLGFGYGYPLFVFYPPLVYMVGEIYHLAGLGFIDATKLVIFTSILGSAFAMYLAAKTMWGKVPGLVATAFYIFVPYRALDVYVRGALAESFTFVWLPLIFWSFWQTAETKKPIYIYLSALFLALLMITHNLIFLPFMTIVPFYLLLLMLISKDKGFLFAAFLKSAVLSTGLSAFFWLPAIVEKSLTLVDQFLLVNLASYTIHFVYPQQLWNWPWGFGGSAPGLNDGISFKIGKLHVLVSAAVFLISATVIILNRRKKLLPTTYYLLPTFFALFVFSAFMTTPYSKFSWDILKPLQYLQFPWRYLTFTALFSSFLAGAFIWSLRLPILRLLVSIPLLIVLIVPNLKLFKPQTYRPDLTDQKATSDETIKWDVSQTSYEYLPKGIELAKNDRGANVLDIKKDQIENQRVSVESGDVSIANLRENANKVTFDINSKENSNILINLYSFPFWKVHIDGQEVQTQNNNRLGLIALDIPSGSHKVAVNFQNTPLMNLANMISLVSIAGLLALVFSKKWQKNRN